MKCYSHQGGGVAWSEVPLASALLALSPPCPRSPSLPPSPPRSLQALFKGLGPNYLKVVPSIAIAFATYEEVKELLGAEIRISD